MTGNIILLLIPAVTAGMGVLCSKFSRKAFFCAAFGIILFCTAGYGGISGIGYTFRESLAYPYAAEVPAVSIDSPPGYIFLMRLCELSGADINFFMMISAAIGSVLAACFIYFRCSSPYEGAFVYAACFMLTAFISTPAFVAVSLCIHAPAFAGQHRFFRFAALVLAASCFDMSALIVIPFYMIYIIPNAYIASALGAAIPSAFVLIPGVSDAVFAFFGAGTYISHVPSLLCVISAAAAAVIALVMTPMLKSRNEALVCHIPALAGGAAALTASLWDGRLFVPALILLTMSLVTLSPDICAIGKRFVEILFPAKKETAAVIFTVVCAVIVFVPYVYMIFTDRCGSDMFGALFGDLAVKTGEAA